MAPMASRLGGGGAYAGGKGSRTAAVTTSASVASPQRFCSRPSTRSDSDMVGCAVYLRWAQRQRHSRKVA
eukprot:scaffold113588_cov33-Phaeocystis_antarctica.AAC.1